MLNRQVLRPSQHLYVSVLLHAIMVGMMRLEKVMTDSMKIRPVSLMMA